MKMGFVELATFWISILMISPQHSRGMTTVGPDPDRAGCCASVVAPNGYKCQEFEVTTEDGYILSVQRIPAGGAENGDGGGTSKQPVLLQHGILMDGMTWLLNSPEESLAFVLADSGFDVWIANIRGTRWSRRHVSLDPSSRAYWDWSWDELVAYELPALVDLVYQQTGQKMHYVGHSLGTLIALASLSEGKSADKLKSAALLSPVAYLTHMSAPLGIIAARIFLGEILSNWLGWPEFNPNSVLVISWLRRYCNVPGVDCYNLLISFTGNNCCLNASTVELFLKYEPQPTSMKNMVHLSQIFRDRTISKYRYSTMIANIIRYGQSTPPIYNLSNIPNNFPLFFSYGGRDIIADPSDVEFLLSDDLKFHDADRLTAQFVKDFAHADFIMGVSANEIVYKEIIAFFDRNS